jgi:hypothetical protein
VKAAARSTAPCSSVTSTAERPFEAIVPGVAAKDVPQPNVVWRSDGLSNVDHRTMASAGPACVTLSAGLSTEVDVVRPVPEAITRGAPSSAPAGVKSTDDSDQRTSCSPMGGTSL